MITLLSGNAELAVKSRKYLQEDFREKRAFWDFRERIVNRPRKNLDWSEAYQTPDKINPWSSCLYFSFLTQSLFLGSSGGRKIAILNSKWKLSLSKRGGGFQEFHFIHTSSIKKVPVNIYWCWLEMKREAFWCNFRDCVMRKRKVLVTKLHLPSAKAKQLLHLTDEKHHVERILKSSKTQRLGFSIFEHFKRFKI